MICLVPIAQKPGRHPAFRKAIARFRRELPEANPGWRFEFRVCRKLFDGVHGEKIPAARNWLLDRHLKPEHDYVFWIDDDIVDMPADLPTRMHAANPGGVTAPLVLIEDTGDPGMFYDTRGFIEDGDFVSAFPPYFKDRTVLEALVRLDCVGCCYLAPAWLYREGVRYPRSEHDLSRTGVTDHAHVCAEARSRGLTVGCVTTERVFHAFLPNYGEQFR